jgi:hypothetical protein
VRNRRRKVLREAVEVNDRFMQQRDHRSNHAIPIPRFHASIDHHAGFRISSAYDHQHGGRVQSHFGLGSSHRRWQGVNSHDSFHHVIPKPMSHVSIDHHCNNRI